MCSAQMRRDLACRAKTCSGVLLQLRTTSSGFRASSPRRSESMSELTSMTAAEIADAVAARRASAVEVAQAHLDRIDAVDGAVRAFLHVDAEGALAAARAVDARLQAGEVLS